MKTNNLMILPQDQARIDKGGFIVSMSGSDFVVRHPLLARKKYEGWNLSTELTKAEMDLEALQKKGGKAKLPGLGNGPKPKPPEPYASNPNAKTIAEVVADDKERVKAKRKSKPASPPVNGEARPVRLAKPKRGAADWKTYRIGMLILRNPDKTADEIMALCREADIDTKLMTVVGLSRYIKLTVQLLADLESEKQAATK